ncbi:MAG: sigma-70 family RNA polymerase sigma factor [Planctomycetota bacterium]
MTESSFDWSRYRVWLRALLRAGIDPRIRAKLDPSDLVQQTLLQALDSLPSFRGSTEQELQAWLRTILARNVARASRDFARLRRDVDREVTESLEQSSVRLEGFLSARVSSPASQAMKSEQVLELCQAIENLPESQQHAINLHHWQGMTINAVADEMDKTPAAVAGLLKRGMKSLRAQLRRREEQPENHE